MNAETEAKIIQESFDRWVHSLVHLGIFVNEIAMVLQTADRVNIVFTCDETKEAANLFQFGKESLGFQDKSGYKRNVK
jgi:hypothetical protein